MATAIDQQHWPLAFLRDPGLMSTNISAPGGELRKIIAFRPIAEWQNPTGSHMGAVRLWDSQDTELIRHTPESHHNVSQRSHLKGTLQGSGLHCRVSGHFEDRRCQPMIGAFGSRTFPSLCDRRHRHAEIWPRLSPNVIRHLCVLRALP